MWNVGIKVRSGDRSTTRRPSRAPRRTREACSGSTGIAPDLADLALDIEVSSPSPKDRVEAMLAAWRERCPIYLALLKPNSIALTTTGAASVG